MAANEFFMQIFAARVGVECLCSWNYLECFTSELDFVALDVFNKEDLELSEVVQGEVADGITEDAFLRQARQYGVKFWGLGNTMGQ